MVGQNCYWPDYLCFLLFLCFWLLFPYMINWTEDQSQFDLQNYSANTNIQVENSSGKMGASIANLFLYKWFGIASFSFIFLLVLFSLHLVKVKIMPLGKATKYVIIGTLWTSVTLSFIFGDNYLILGGSHGYHNSTWLVSLLENAGTAFVLLILLGGFVFVYI
jgi:S-DNA-T family DNA segregation ATPase FtsK/SpoIIIE